MSKLESRDGCADFQARLKMADTAPLLRTIEGWLRTEKDRKTAARKARLAAAADSSFEGTDEDARAATAGTGNAVADPTSMSAGHGNGFSAGRMAAYISMTE